MTYTTERLSADELLNILALSDNATAIYTTEDIRIETANDKMIAAWHKDRSVIGKTIEEALPELKNQPFFDILKNVWRTGITYIATAMPADIETNGNMQRYYFDFEYRAIKKADGEMLCILHTSHDVSEVVIKEETIRAKEIELVKLNKDFARANRDLAESNHELQRLNDNLVTTQKDMSVMYARLMASEEKFRSVMEQIPVAVNVLSGRELRIELVNDLFLEIWGKQISIQEAAGQTLTEVNPEFTGQPFMQILDDVYTTGTTFYGNSLPATVMRNGVPENRYYNVIYRALRDENGKINGIVQIAGDNTAEVMATLQIKELNEELATTNEELAAGNEELRSLNEEMQTIQEELVRSNHRLVEFEERFRAITGSSEIMISVTSIEGKPIYINESLQQFTGLSLSEFAGIGYANLVHPDDKAEYLESFNRAFAYRKEYDDEFRLRFSDGSYRLLRSQVMPMSDTAGNFIGFVRTLLDITESRQAQARLQELNEEMAVNNEELQSTNDEMLLIQNRLMIINGELTESEERFRSMAESTNVFIGVSDADGNAVYLNRLWSETTGRSNESLLAHGWTDLLHPDDTDRSMKIFMDAMASKVAYTDEFRIRNKEGKYIWLLLDALPRMHADGTYAGHIGSAFDITERKLDDQRKNDFIGMVSHELKTPLTSLNGYLEIVKMDLREAGNIMGTSLLDKAGKQVSKMTTMINGFLNVSRLESGKLQIEKRRFDMAKLVEESKEEVKGLYNNHNIIFEPVEETWVFADWDKIGHVLNNFISNAAKYSPYRTTIQVACITVDGNAVVAVRDEGMGIEPGDQERLFERYYRVENKVVQAVAGFGIGLYLCAEIIHRNDGNIWVESEPGKGSVFYFSLPVVS